MNRVELISGKFSGEEFDAMIGRVEFDGRAAVRQQEHTRRHLCCPAAVPPAATAQFPWPNPILTCKHYAVGRLVQLGLCQRAEPEFEFLSGADLRHPRWLCKTIISLVIQEVVWSASDEEITIYNDAALARGTCVNFAKAFRHIYPPLRVCMNTKCPNHRESDDIMTLTDPPTYKATLFTARNGALSVYASSLYCRTLQINTHLKICSRDGWYFCAAYMNRGRRCPWTDQTQITTERKLKIPELLGYTQHQQNVIDVGWLPRPPFFSSPHVHPSSPAVSSTWVHFLVLSALCSSQIGAFYKPYTSVDSSSLSSVISFHNRPNYLMGSLCGEMSTIPIFAKPLPTRSFVLNYKREYGWDCVDAAREVALKTRRMGRERGGVAETTTEMA
ncbi:hypothetical protein B0H11DRAFT_1923035 [Mycena galericulata]|nr:hypothetical protein B0H11DRAFT_1923035 [Mycena galericulata]